MNGCNTLCNEIIKTGRIPQKIYDIDPFLGDYLKALVRNQAQLFSTELSTAAHIKGWKKTKEHTSAGGYIHFGDTKAGTQDSNIAAFEACLSGIPWITGYSPKRWRNGVSIMIFKKPQELSR